MTFAVTKTSRVYIVAPAQLHTGGPELLHQLGAELLQNGVQVFMYYYPNVHPQPVHDNYKKYKVPFVRLLPDDTNAIIVFPETQIPRALKIKKAQVAIWWMSVDNYFVAVDFYQQVPAWKRLLKFSTLFATSDWSKVFERNFHHFAQSHYAIDFLKKKNIHDVDYLSDYLSSLFLSEGQSKKKKDIVCFNPKKGGGITKALMEADSSIEFVPLVNMTPSQVKETLGQAKVYVDFGEHPGKDRIPREAAFMGACIIVGKKGSAAHFEDLPIPDEYKFDFDHDEINIIINTIKECFGGYDQRKSDFYPYIDMIKNEELKFRADVKKCFKLN